MSSFYNLPALGERVTLLTHFVVREDAQVLFGFLTARGARDLPPAGEDLRRRPAHRAGDPVGPEGGRTGAGGDAAGKRRAWSRCRASARRPPSACCSNSRASSAPTSARAGAASASDAQADILQALVALGYSEREAAAALKALPRRCRRRRRHQAGAARPAPSSCAAGGRARLSACAAPAARRGACASTSNSTWTSPAFSNCSVSGNVWPGLSGCFRPDQHQMQAARLELDRLARRQLDARRLRASASRRPPSPSRAARTLSATGVAADSSRSAGATADDGQEARRRWLRRRRSGAPRRWPMVDAPSLRRARQRSPRQHGRGMKAAIRRSCGDCRRTRRCAGTGRES